MVLSASEELVSQAESLKQKNVDNFYAMAIGCNFFCLILFSSSSTSDLKLLPLLDLRCHQALHAPVILVYPTRPAEDLFLENLKKIEIAQFLDEQIRRKSDVFLFSVHHAFHLLGTVLLPQCPEHCTRWYGLLKIDSLLKVYKANTMLYPLYLLEKIIYFKEGIEGVESTLISFCPRRVASGRTRRIWKCISGAPFSMAEVNKGQYQGSVRQYCTVHSATRGGSFASSSSSSPIAAAPSRSTSSTALPSSASFLWYDNES